MVHSRWCDHRYSIQLWKLRKPSPFRNWFTIKLQAFVYSLCDAGSLYGLLFHMFRYCFFLLLSVAAFAAAAAGGGARVCSSLHTPTQSIKIRFEFVFEIRVLKCYRRPFIGCLIALWRVELELVWIDIRCMPFTIGNLRIERDWMKSNTTFALICLYIQ